MATATRAPRKIRTSSLGVWTLVAVPTLLILSCGILILIYNKSAFDVVMGLLLVLFCLALGAGVAVTLFGIHADRKLADLQIDFVSKVSHELKTPLTSIRMFVETLRLGRVQDPARVKHCLEVIEKETDRLSTLIGRLLSWGAMEAGAFKIDLEPRAPKEVIESALRAFEPQAMSGQAKLSVEVEDNLPTVNADQQALTDALLNLLNNSLKYTGPDKMIRLKAARKDERHITISVEDNGIGIEPRHHRRVFDRFYRADDGLARSAEGTGLGLAIARHVVLAHGGTIELSSKVGEGSTFTIVLPTALPSAQKPPNDAPQAGTAS